MMGEMCYQDDNGEAGSLGFEYINDPSHITGIFPNKLAVS